MLRFERQVVASLMETQDPERRAAVERFVGESLAAMPEHLRLGVLAESVALGTWARLRRRSHADLVDSLRTNPIGLLRQYERLLGSLVLFAEQEFAEGSAA
jgi:hypothetical protein